MAAIAPGSASANRTKATMRNLYNHQSSDGNTRASAAAQKNECCMCGDVGFQDRLFKCRRCRHRLQHIYCSRLYSTEMSEGALNICDWCLDQEEKQQQSNSSIKRSFANVNSSSEIREREQVVAGNSASKGIVKLHFKLNSSKKSSDTTPEYEKEKESPRSSNPTHANQSSKSLGHRRYKLLSDVLC